MKRLFLILLPLCICLASCSGKVSEEFLANPSLCLESDGDVIFSYSPADCQISFNQDKKQFRVMDDTMSKYYMVTLNDMPSSLGQKLSADIVWVSGNGVQNLSDVELKVEKIEGDQVWLWSSRRKLAVSVRIIR